MNLNYLHPETLSSSAMELVQFDVDSIRQVVAGQHAPQPETWLVDPGQYERNGRLLRDSPTYRIVAYSAANRVLYACDGCNACSQAAHDLSSVPGVSEELLRRLASLVSVSSEQ